MVGLAYAMAVVAFALFLWIFWYVVSRLDVGVDTSDSAYYIISYAMHRDIEAQSTLAGWVWAAMSPFGGILANRYLGVAFLLACFGVLALAGRKDIAPDSGGLLLAIAFSLSGAMTYYLRWLPDPSYNLINLGFIALAWAGFFKLRSASLTGERTVMPAEVGWAIIVGLAMMAVFLSKPTSAMVLGPIVLVLYLATARRVLHIRRLLALALAAMIGCASVFLLLASIGESPLRVIKTMQEGYRLAMQIAAPPFNPVGQFSELVTFIAAGPLFGGWQAPVLLAVVLLAVGPRSIGAAIPLLIRTCLSFAAAGAILFLVWWDTAFIPIDTLCTLVVLAICFALVGIFALPRKQQGSALLFSATMSVSLLIYVYGTGGGWGNLLALSAGFAFTALGVTLWTLQTEKRILLAIPSLALLGVALAGTARGIEDAPYRLMAPMSDLTSIAHVGPLDEEFYDSTKQATFYNTLADIRPMVEKLPERPYLIDLSGRTPMVAYQIGAKPPHTPWLLAGYPGSEQVFRLTMKTIASGDLSNAWIFQSHGDEIYFPDSLLGEFGLDFPADYVPIVAVPVEYLGVNGTLFAPKKTIRDANLSGYLNSFRKEYPSSEEIRK